MGRLLNSDAWAHGLPCALLAALIVAVLLGGCANNGLGGKTLKEFWDEHDRAAHALPRRP